ncbi:MAG: AAA family ATPase [Bacteroidetes bacterium]|nr:AAA family ATPase [Bacteroidota bacterium]MCL5024986.1 AAA family ATPase [Chloroflexota bacterium]
MAGQTDRIGIERIPSGIPQLDPVLGGGVPAYSVNILAGAPGVGKTTLAHQFLFHNATPAAKAIYFAALGEPTIKMLRYQQQFDFYDASRIETAIFYEDLGSIAIKEGLAKTLEHIAEGLSAVTPAFVAIDSFKGIKEIGELRGENVRSFVHDISSLLATWNVTTFLLGEYAEDEIFTEPEFSAVDGIIMMSQQPVGNAVVHKLQVVKLRGQPSLSGKHTFRINSNGIEIFPRMVPIAQPTDPLPTLDRLKFGVSGLDEMMAGGIPRGEATLIAGSAGTGKTLLSLHFIAEGVRQGEPGVMVTFEEHPREQRRKALGFGWDLSKWEEQDLLRMIYLRPLDLSVDEVLYRVHRTAREVKAKRVVINSISGFELGISPSDEPEFREALYRLIATLSAEGITTLMTTEIPNVFVDFVISPLHVSFLADNVIILRYAEIESQLRRFLMVVKMRTSNHSLAITQFRITEKGVVVESPLTEYSGVLSGIPTLRTLLGPQPMTAGLSPQEETLMHALLAQREATAEQLAEGMNIAVDQARDMLGKLVDTGYVVRRGPKADAKYRVALVTPGVSVRRR